MKLHELTESKYDDPDKFMEYLADIMRDYSVDPDMVTTAETSTSKEIFGDIEGINYDSQLDFVEHTKKILTKLFGKPTQFKLSPASVGSMTGWRVGPYYIGVVANKVRENKTIGDLIVYSIEDLRDTYDKGVWV